MVPKKIRGWTKVYSNTFSIPPTSWAESWYAIPKIKMLCNLHCLKARLRLLCNKYQRHSSLNLVSQQLKLCDIFIFGMAYWSITMIFMQLTIQLIHCHVLICIIICYKPKGNIIILLSPSELKSDFISIQTSWPDVNCHHFISYERQSLHVKRQFHILFRNCLFQNDGGCFKCLLSTRISFTHDNLKIFWKLNSIRHDYTASNRK